MEFYGYKKCSTCRNAYKVLAGSGMDMEFRDFVKNPPSRRQLQDWAGKMPNGIQDLVNPRGTRYRELGLAQKSLNEKEWLELLSQDGKLLKRPLLVKDSGELVVGFDKAAYRILGADLPGEVK